MWIRIGRPALDAVLLRIRKNDADPTESRSTTLVKTTELLKNWLRIRFEVFWTRQEPLSPERSHFLYL
jgi:hypothetical protein